MAHMQASMTANMILRYIFRVYDTIAISGKGEIVLIVLEALTVQEQGGG